MRKKVIPETAPNNFTNKHKPFSLHTNLNINQVTQDILQPKNLLPAEFQTLQKVKERIEDHNTNSIYAEKKSWKLQSTLPIGLDITCAEYFQLPTPSGVFSNSVCQTEEGVRFSHCRGLWLGDKEGTISVYSPITKEIKKSVFKFDNKLKNISTMDFYSDDKLTLCYVAAANKDGDIGVSAYFSSKVTCRVHGSISHKSNSKVKQICLSQGAVLLIVTEDKYLSAYQMKFDFRDDSKKIEFTPADVGTVPYQGKIEEIYITSGRRYVAGHFTVHLMIITHEPIEQLYNREIIEIVGMEMEIYKENQYGTKNLYFNKNKADFSGMDKVITSNSCLENFCFVEKYKKLQSLDPKETETIPLPLQVEINQSQIPEIKLGENYSVSYLNQSTFEVYTSSSWEKKYDLKMKVENVKSGFYHEEMIMAITYNNELEVYESCGTSQDIHASYHEIFCLNISPDCTNIAHGDSAGWVGVRNLKDGGKPHLFVNIYDIMKQAKTVYDQQDESDDDQPYVKSKKPERAIWSVSFIDSESLDILVVGCDGILNKIQMEEKKIVWQRTLKKNFSSVVVSQKEILVGFTNGSFHIYDENGKIKQKYKFNGQRAQELDMQQATIAFSSDNNIVAFALLNEIRIYDRKNCLDKLLTNLSELRLVFRNEIKQLEFSSDGKILYVALQQRIAALSVANGKQIPVNLSKEYYSLNTIFSTLVQDHKYICCWGNSAFFIIDTVFDKKVTPRLNGLKGDISVVRSCPDARQLLIGTFNGIVRVLDLAPLFVPLVTVIPKNPFNKFGRSFSKTDENEIYGTTFSESGDLIAVEYGVDLRSIVVYAKEKIEALYEIQVPMNTMFSKLFFTPDNNFLIRIGGKSILKIDLQKKRVVELKFDNIVVGVRLTDYNPRSMELFITAQDDPNVHVFSLQQALNPEKFLETTTGQKVRILNRERKELLVTMKLSCDGVLLSLLTGSQDIEVYEASSGNLINYIPKNPIDQKIFNYLCHGFGMSSDKRYIFTFLEESIRVYHRDSQLMHSTFTLQKDSREGYHDNMYYPRIKSGIEMSRDSRYLVAFYYGSVQVFDMDSQKTVLHCQPFGSKQVMVYLKISPDQKSILLVSHLRQIAQIAFPFKHYHCPVQNENVPVYSYLDRAYFEVFVKELKDTVEIEEFVLKYKDIYLCPYKWTLLHFLVIFRPETIQKALAIPNLKFSFLIDTYGKTPLHYLLAAPKINYVAVNNLLSYILEFLGSIRHSQPVQFQEIIEALSGLFPILFRQINHSSVLTFLRFCVSDAAAASDEGVPLFGRSLDYPLTNQGLSMTKQNLDKLYDPNDNKMIEFKSMTLYLDYNPISSDMIDTSIALQGSNNEEFFKTRTIATLIDYLWNSHFSFLAFQTAAFSILMILISVYIGLGDSNFGLEITILVLGSVFAAFELIEISKWGILTYFNSLWNVIDVLFCGTLIGSIIACLAGLEPGLARAWLYTVMVLSGYIRWIIHFRIFGPTRKFIRMVIEIVKDMSSFLAILIFIIFAFSLILLEFDREQEFKDHLLSAYGLIYGNYDTDEVSSSLIAIMIFVVFAVSVVLLNLLIAMMGNTYSKVEDSGVLVDALERLDMIVDTIVIKRIFTFKSLQTEKSYLMFCQDSAVDENEENNELALIQKIMKQVDSNNQKIMKEVGSNNQKIDALTTQIAEIMGILKSNEKKD